MGSRRVQQRDVADCEFNGDSEPGGAGTAGQEPSGIRRLARWFSRESDRLERLRMWIKKRTSWSRGAEMRGERALRILDAPDHNICRTRPLFGSVSPSRGCGMT